MAAKLCPHIHQRDEPASIARLPNAETLSMEAALYSAAGVTTGHGRDGGRS
jgi:hypothetical protein